MMGTWGIGTYARLHAVANKTQAVRNVREIIRQHYSLFADTWLSRVPPVGTRLRVQTSTGAGIRVHEPHVLRQEWHTERGVAASALTLPAVLTYW
jgi:hypothetical protein